jgi:hypothetical protein
MELKERIYSTYSPRAPYIYNFMALTSFTIQEKFFWLFCKPLIHSQCSKIFFPWIVSWG